MEHIRQSMCGSNKNKNQCKSNQVQVYLQGYFMTWSHCRATGSTLKHRGYFNAPPNCVILVKIHSYQHNFDDYTMNIAMILMTNKTLLLPSSFSPSSISSHHRPSPRSAFAVLLNKHSEAEPEKSRSGWCAFQRRVLREFILSVKSFSAHAKKHKIQTNINALT